MTEQEIVDHFAQLAKPRLLELLKPTLQYVYDPVPGHANSTFHVNGAEVRLRSKQSTERYGDIHRFLAPDKVMGFVINPGLVPLVKAMALDSRGRQVLVTRRIAGRDSDRGAVAHLHGIGVRLLMQSDPEQKDTLLIWECLYGAA